LYKIFTHNIAKGEEKRKQEVEIKELTKFFIQRVERCRSYGHSFVQYLG